MKVLPTIISKYERRRKENSKCWWFNRYSEMEREKENFTHNIDMSFGWSPTTSLAPAAIWWLWSFTRIYFSFFYSFLSVHRKIYISNTEKLTKWFDTRTNKRKNHIDATAHNMQEEDEREAEHSYNIHHQWSFGRNIATKMIPKNGKN